MITARKEDENTGESGNSSSTTGFWILLHAFRTESIHLAPKVDSARQDDALEWSYFRSSSSEILLVSSRIKL